MVFELILLAVALIGSTLASAYDLKTTEVPDWIFYFMFGVGLPVVVIQSVLSHDISIFLLSATTGLGLLAFGFLMYRFGQWGGADMLMLALLGFLVPKIPLNFNPNLLFPFSISFLFNVFFIGAAYMILYAIVIALKNKKIIKAFLKDLKASSRIILITLIGLFILFFVLSSYFSQLFFPKVKLLEIIKTSLVPLVLLMAWIILYKFAQVVEKVGFRKRIPVSKLRVGDMLLEKRELVGIDEKQLRKIKKSGKKFIWIKEGVRFAPVFPLALLFTLYVGDAILFVKLLL